MRNHLFRPLFLVIGFVITVLVARYFAVPDDFGINGRNFTYGYYRLGSIEDWRQFPVAYRGRKYCIECHDEEARTITSSVHKAIQCENCHGPARKHPEDPERMQINRDRALCLRCHSALPYPSSQRAKLPGIDPSNHNPEAMCVDCHNPHNPVL